MLKKKGGGPSLPNTDTAGPSNVVSTRDNLLGLEDLAHGADEHGIPFILVDAVACTTRCDLDKALSQMEQRRMEQVIKDIDDSKLPLLVDIEPPPELDMTSTLSSEAMADVRAAEEERRFLKDISDLTFWTPEEEKEDLCTSPTATTHNATELRTKGRQLLNTNSNLEQVRFKLEKLREESIPDPDPATKATCPGRPSIQRQGTFEIKRKNDDKKGLGSEINIKEAASSKQTQSLQPSHQDGMKTKITSTEDLKRTEQPSENPKQSSRTQQIINQVGDLLVELSSQNQQDNNRVLAEGASYSFMVTISPANGATNCTIQAITGLKSSIIKATEQPQSQLPLSRNPPINIFSPSSRVRSESSTNPIVIGRNSHGPGSTFTQSSPVKFAEQRSRSQLLAKMPCSFLKVPAPAKYCHGRMRD